jgi:hypothetical protein
MPRRVPSYAEQGSRGSLIRTRKPEEAVRQACKEISHQLRLGSKAERRYITKERDGNYYVVRHDADPGSINRTTKKRAPRRTVAVVSASNPHHIKVRELQPLGVRLGGEWSCEDEEKRHEREERRRHEQDPSSPEYHEAEMIRRRRRK